MAEPSLQQEEVKLKGTFAGQAIDLAAKGTTIVLLAAVGTVGVLALREHTKRESAEEKIVSTLAQQNNLLHEQTNELRVEMDHINCNVGIDIFVHQFPRGEVNWDSLPVHLYACLPDYSKKMPKGR